MVLTREFILSCPVNYRGSLFKESVIWIDPVLPACLVTVIAWDFPALWTHLTAPPRVKVIGNEILEAGTACPGPGWEYRNASVRPSLLIRNGISTETSCPANGNGNETWNGNKTCGSAFCPPTETSRRNESTSVSVVAATGYESDCVLSGGHAPGHAPGPCCHQSCYVLGHKTETFIGWGGGGGMRYNDQKLGVKLTLSQGGRKLCRI